jgi:uracil-DNA glycosylase
MNHVISNPVPADATTVDELRAAAARCRNCPLWRHGTQTVFGEGNRHAKLVIVGEQPGDREDLSGHPFVGPAGSILDRVLEQCGVSRDDVYVTNAVKHFKWELRGKRRVHKTPAQREIEACLPWLEAEVSVLKPRLVLCLGATAAKAVLGTTVRINEARGHALRSPTGRNVVVTMHPAYLLRLRPPSNEAAYQLFAADVQLAVKIAGA